MFFAAAFSAASAYSAVFTAVGPLVAADQCAASLLSGGADGVVAAFDLVSDEPAAVDAGEPLFTLSRNSG